MISKYFKYDIVLVVYKIIIFNKEIYKWSHLDFFHKYFIKQPKLQDFNFKLSKEVSEFCIQKLKFYIINLKSTFSLEMLIFELLNFEAEDMNCWWSCLNVRFPDLLLELSTIGL